MEGVRLCAIKGPSFSWNGSLMMSLSRKRLVKNGLTSSEFFGPPILSIRIPVFTFSWTFVDMPHFVTNFDDPIMMTVFEKDNLNCFNDWYSPCPKESIELFMFWGVNWCQRQLKMWKMQLTPVNLLLWNIFSLASLVGCMEVKSQQSFQIKMCNKICSRYLFYSSLHNRYVNARELRKERRVSKKRKRDFVIKIINHI